MLSDTFRVTIVGVILITLVGVFQVSAQTADELLAINEGLNEALAAHDVDAWVSYFADDAVFDFVPAPEPFPGREGVRMFFEDLLSAFPDYTTLSEQMWISGNIVVTAHTTQATLLGEWMGMPPTGVEGVPHAHLDVWEYDGDQVQRLTTYTDMVTLMVSAGLIPVPEMPDLTPSFVLPEPELTGLDPLEVSTELVVRFNAHDMAELAKILHPDAEIRFNTLGMLPLNRDAYIALDEQFLLSSPTLRAEIVRQVDLGDGWVLAEAVYRGIHDGPYFGIPATGKPTVTRSAALSRADSDGLVTDFYYYFDNLSVLTQIGAFPPPPSQEEMIRAGHQTITTALNTQDLDLLGTVWADDAVYDYVPAPAPLEGKDAVQGFFADTFETFPDFGTDPGQHWISDNLFVIEHNAFGTQLGVFEGMVPPTGNTVVIPHVDISEYEGDKIKRITTYTDVTSMLIQMGAMPMPEMPPLEASFALPAPEPTGLAPLEAQEEIMVRWNAHDWAAWSAMVHSDVDAFYGSLGVPLDRSAVVAVQELYAASFPDIRGDMVRAVDMGDGWVLAEALFTGTHGAPFFGVPATGVIASAMVAWMARYDAEGLMTYFHVYHDNLTLLAQIGAFPPPPDTEANKALVRRSVEDVWNVPNLDVVDEVYAPDVYFHDPTGDYQSAEARKMFVAAYLSAYSDIQFAIDDQVAAGDYVATRWTNTAVHTGDFMGIPPTGALGTTTGITIAHIVNGRIAEQWDAWDTLGMFEHIGVLPATREEYGWGAASPITGDPGTPEANKAIVTQYVEELWNQKQLEPIYETIIHPGTIFHNPMLDSEMDVATQKAVTMAFFHAFPDLHVDMEPLIAEGDAVVEQWVASGTQSGELLGIPATGKAVEWAGVTVYRLADGKIVETWWAYDALGLMQQLGAIPSFEPEDFGHVFFMPLAKGLNMLSLPLKPMEAYTARSLAEKLGATAVIRIDPAMQKFVGWTPDASDDGFPVEGGQGYIVNVIEPAMVAFTGAAWTRPPMPAAPVAEPADSTWAFVVNAQLEETDWSLQVRNTATGALLGIEGVSHHRSGVWADLNRTPVVHAGDVLEVVVSDSSGIVGSLGYTVQPDDIGRAYATLPVTLAALRPDANALLANYPNPFNPETWIPYQLAASGDVQIHIFDVQGRLVRALELGYQPAGYYLNRTRAAYWDGTNTTGERVSSGVYVLSLQTSDFTAIRRMLLMK